VKRSRRLVILSAVSLAASVAAIVIAAPSASAAVAFTSTAVNRNGNNCMTVPGGSSANAVQLQQQACTSAASQNFTFNPVAGTTDTYNIATLTAGKCVDVNGASTADNATIIQWTCHSNNNQRWRLVPIVVTGADKTFQLIGVQSGKCIVPSGGSAAANTGLVQLPCSTASSRIWRLANYTAGTGGGNTFTNPLSLHGPDPYLTYYNGNYYLVTTTWNMTITMRRSPTLAGLKTASDVVVMNLSSFPNACCNMWAPEIHLLTGPNGTRWYLYFTAGQNIANYLGTQRIHVLESSGLDPMGPYTFKADMLDPTQNNTWELDGSILQLNGQLYLMGTFYNGSQPAFIRPLSNPWTASGTRRILVSPTLSWETVGGAVAEGPEALQHNGRTFVIYSASHCSTPDYKMGMLTYNGGDPLLSSSWTKSANPVFQRSNANSVYGPGHGNFFVTPSGEDWMAYHANASTSGGCDMNRTTRVQRFSWNADGTPNFGTPLSLSTQITPPAGE
jgi:GH43 family beta-xylosidase